jgi:hypothetical protein
MPSLFISRMSPERSPTPSQAPQGEARVGERLTTAARAERWTEGQAGLRRAILVGDRWPWSDVLLAPAGSLSRV